MRKLFLLLLLCFFLHVPAFADNAEVTAPSAEQEALEEAKAVQEAWEALLATHNTQITELNNDLQKLKEDLPARSASIRQNTALLRQEFEKLNTLSHVNGGMPSDLTVLMERFNRIKERLDALVQPMQETLGHLSRAQKSVDLLEASLSSQGSTLANSDFKKKVSATQKMLKELKERCEFIIAPSHELASQIQARIDNLSQQMPSLWKNHYFQSSGHFYDVVAWARDFRNLNSFRELFALRLTTEVPNTLSSFL